MSFGLLLRLQLVIKLLLQFLFGEVHFTNGSVVLYPPLAAWRKSVQFRKNVRVTFGCLPRLMQAWHRIQTGKGLKSSEMMDAVDYRVQCTACDGYRIQGLKNNRIFQEIKTIFNQIPTF